MKIRLLPILSTLAALSAAGAQAASPGQAAAPGDRLTVVTLQSGSATVYSGDGLAKRRGLRGADRAELSPNGELLAYTRLVDGTTEIRLTRVDGGSDRLVARVRPYDIALAFSPDGTRLTFSSAAGIETTPVAATARRRVPLPSSWRGSRFNHLAYRPDGRRLLVSRTWGDGRKGTLGNELAALDPTTGAATRLYRSANPYDMRARPTSFSPDGSLVAVDGTGGIAIVPTRGGAPRRLTERRANGYDHSPLISPDGRLIAFARAPYRGMSDVFVMNADGTGLRRVTTTRIPPLGTPKVGTTPLAWSPDASRLLVFRHDRFAIVDVASRAITNVRRVGVRYAIPTVRWPGAPLEPPRTGTIVFERRDESGTGDLYTIRADGSGLRRLTNDGRSHDPAWSPDGRRIAFTSGPPRSLQLHVMREDGADRQQLTSFGPELSVVNPSWFAGGVGGERILFARYQPGEGPSDLFAVGSDGGTPTPVADSPEPERNGSMSRGGRLAFEVNLGVRVRDGDGRVARLGAGTEPQWSPDGRRLAVSVYHSLNFSLIVVMDADGRNAKTLGAGWSPSWSPDGTALVYTTRAGLVVERADGTGVRRQITRTGRLDGHFSPSWRNS